MIFPLVNLNNILIMSSDLINSFVEAVKIQYPEFTESQIETVKSNIKKSIEERDDESPSVLDSIAFSDNLTDTMITSKINDNVSVYYNKNEITANNDFLSNLSWQGFHSENANSDFRSPFLIALAHTDIKQLQGLVNKGAKEALKELAEYAKNKIKEIETIYNNRYQFNDIKEAQERLNNLAYTANLQKSDMCFETKVILTFKDTIDALKLFETIKLLMDDEYFKSGEWLLNPIEEGCRYTLEQFLYDIKSSYKEKCC